MICKKCGAFMNDGEMFCTKCGEKVESSFDNNSFGGTGFQSFDQTPQKPPKKSGGLLKKILIPVIAAGVVGVVGITIVAAAIPVIKNAFINSKSPEEYLQYVVIKKNNISASAAEAISSIKDIANGEVNYKGSVEIELGKNFVDFADECGAADEFLDMVEKEDWLKKAGLSFQTSSKPKDSLTGVSASASLNGTDVLTADYILDTNNEVFYLAIPELSDTYMGMEIPGVRMSVAEMSELMKEISDKLPNEKVSERLVNKYTEIALTHFDDVTKEKTTISVENVSQKGYLLTVEVTDKDMLQIGQKILEEMKYDEDFRASAEPIAELIAESIADELEMAGYGSAVTSQITSAYLMENLDESLDMFIEALKREEAALSGENVEFVIKIYTNKSHEIIGFELEAMEEEVFSFLSAEKGGKFADELVIAGETFMTGSGKVFANKRSGEYIFGIDGEEYIKVTVKDFNTKKLRENKLNGKFIIELGDDYPDYVDDVIEDSKLEIEIKHGEDEISAEVTVVYNEEDAISMKLSAEQKNSSKLSVPKKYIELDPGTMDGIEDYIDTIDIEGFVKNFKKADLPDEYANDLQDALEKAIDMAY